MGYSLMEEYSSYMFQEAFMEKQETGVIHI
jgi:hypothetical protein